MAKEAKVSVATVSRAFNFPDKVTAKTRAKVQAAAVALGYVPNASARTLRTQRSRVLGVVLPSMLNPVFAECLQGIAQAATLAGYSIVPLTTDYRVEQEERAVNLLIAGSVDGVILVVSNPARSTALARLAAGEIPYVLAYNRTPDHPCVSVDSVEAVSEVVLRLAARGHERIAMVSGELAASDRAQQRYRGYVAGIKAAKLRPTLIEVPFVEPAVPKIQAYIDAEEPTALVCSNDLLAIRSVRAVHQSGRRVPEHVSVVGFDGIEIGTDLTPALSTIVQPNAQIGRSAVDLLIDSVETDEPLTPTSSVTLPWTFREGESSAEAVKVLR